MAVCSLDVVLYDVVATVVLPGASLTHPVSGDTKNVLTGSADNSCRLWDCETGRYHHAALLCLTFFICSFIQHFFYLYILVSGRINFPFYAVV